MKTVGLEQLKQRRATLIQEQEQWVAKVNALAGAINFISSLIEEEEAAESATKKNP